MLKIALIDQIIDILNISLVRIDEFPGYLVLSDNTYTTYRYNHLHTTLTSTSITTPVITYTIINDKRI